MRLNLLTMYLLITKIFFQPLFFKLLFVYNTYFLNRNRFKGKNYDIYIYFMCACTRVCMCTYTSMWICIYMHTIINMWMCVGGRGNNAYLSPCRPFGIIMAKFLVNFINNIISWLCWYYWDILKIHMKLMCRIIWGKNYLMSDKHQLHELGLDVWVGCAKVKNRWITKVIWHQEISIV